MNDEKKNSSDLDFAGSQAARWAPIPFAPAFIVEVLDEVDHVAPGEDVIIRVVEPGRYEGEVFWADSLDVAPIGPVARELLAVQR